MSEPGFHVVRQPMSKIELLAVLYGDASAKPDNFDRHNHGLGSQIVPGEMIVIAGPNSLECATQENDLMQIARAVNEEVSQLSEREAQFIIDHYDLLEVMTANAATGLGVGATMIGQQVKSISATLMELEVLHQDTFRKHGALSHPAFFERRQKLFTKLDFALGKVARKGMSLDDDVKLKRALGLSSKSIVHEWKASGVGGIPGYGSHYTKLANAAKYAQGAGYVALGLDSVRMVFGGGPFGRWVRAIHVFAFFAFKQIPKFGPRIAARYGDEAEPLPLDLKLLGNDVARCVFDLNGCVVLDWAFNGI